MYKIKILVIGPPESGKTVISNFLADATETLGGEYHPTQGVRILEFESQNLNVNNKHVKADIELWDCSGDHKFQTCWPVIQHETHGTIFVYNPDHSEHPRELDVLYSHFVEQQGLQHSQCVVFAHVRSSTRERHGGKLSSTFSRIPQIDVNLEEDGNRLRVDFNNFVATILSGLSERREQEELSIMNMRG